jgi:hypothetical protein
MGRIWIFIAQLVVLTLAFALLMQGVVPFPLDVFLAIVGGCLVIYATSSFREAMAAANDIRLVRAIDPNAVAKDGERLAVVGKLRAVGVPLRAPFSRRECVYYRYAAAGDVEARDRKGPVSSDYSGLALARAIVRTSVRETRLVGAPMFTGFEDQTEILTGPDHYDNAERYVAETRFETISLGDADVLARSVHASFDDREGQLRRDVRLAAAGSIRDATLQEMIVPDGAEVCAVGTWSTTHGGLVQKLGTREMMVIYAGGAEGAVARLTASMKRYLRSGGISMGLVSCLVLWRLATLV